MQDVMQYCFVKHFQVVKFWSNLKALSQSCSFAIALPIIFVNSTSKPFQSYFSPLDISVSWAPYRARAELIRSNHATNSGEQLPSLIQTELIIGLRWSYLTILKSIIHAEQKTANRSDKSLVPVSHHP